MTLLVLLLMAGFVAAADCYVAVTAHDYQDGVAAAAFIRELHAESPREFDGRTVREVPPFGSYLRSLIVVHVDEVAGLCEWEQNRDGLAQRFTHSSHHLGGPCPYRVVADVLAGRPDPRDDIPSGAFG